MLVKCCVVFLILSHKIVSCESGMKKKTISTSVNETTSVSTIFSESKQKSTLNMKHYPSNITSGRSLEDYNVVTDDEYILTIFRMTYDNNTQTSNKCPVLLVHGLYQSSDKFLEQIEDQSLALKLQDFGYDVWLANFRGNRYGRQHVSLDPETDDKSIFFDYSYEELGIHDIASTVDFVLNMTGFEKLLYIGHSLGGTAFLVLNSLRPEYNNKFIMAQLMAPIGYQNYFPNDRLTDAFRRLDGIYDSLLKEGSVEIFPYKDKNKKFSTDECLGNRKRKKICRRLNIQKRMGIKGVGNDVNETRGGSLKILVHLGQNVKSKSFSRWDFGKSENKDRYGSYSAPSYDLGLITVPTNILYAQNDEIVSREDIADMVKAMPNAKATKVEGSDFAHEDFLFAPDVMETVYDGILKEFEENPDPSFKNHTTNASNASGPFKIPTWLLVLLIAGGVLILICIVVCVVLKLNKSEPDKIEESCSRSLPEDSCT